MPIESPSTVINQAVERLVDTAGLEFGDARTCVYWRLASNQLQNLDFFPILALIGHAGTGKTSTLEYLSRFPGKSQMQNCMRITPAVFRDKLGDFAEATFFAEEFESDDKRIINALMNRCDRNLAQDEVNKAVTDNKYERRTVNTFGATALHRRNILIDPAVQSRSIQVHTRMDTSGRYFPKHGPPDMLPVPTLQHIGEFQGRGRIRETWAPVLAAAKEFEDYEFLNYIEDIITHEQVNLLESAGEDSANVILAQVVATISDRIDSLNTESAWNRIRINTEIVEPLKRDGYFLGPEEVAANLKAMGLKVTRGKGVNWVKVNPYTLKLAAYKINYEDESLDELTIG